MRLSRLIVSLALLCTSIITTGCCGIVQGLSLTPVPTVDLQTGNTYWIGALIPPLGLPENLTIKDCSVLNKPGSSVNNSSITLIGVLGEGSDVLLTGRQDKYCYVEGYSSFGSRVEGWIDCSRLPDYEPTLKPTLDLTPQKPSD